MNNENKSRRLRLRQRTNDLVFTYAKTFNKKCVAHSEDGVVVSEQCLALKLKKRT